MYQAPDFDDPSTIFSDQNDYETMPNFEVLGEESPLARVRTSHDKWPLIVSLERYLPSTQQISIMSRLKTKKNIPLWVLQIS